MNLTTKKYLGIAALALIGCGGASIATYALNSGETRISLKCLLRMRSLSRLLQL